MRILMQHPEYKGKANVLPADRKDWEAAGWVAVPEAKTTTKKETKE